MDLIISGVRSNTPNVDLILSRAGGTLPCLAQRTYDSLIIEDIARAVLSMRLKLWSSSNASTTTLRLVTRPPS